MKKKFEAEIAANLERADESIRAAGELLGKGYCDFAASRAYYGAFYAATALLLSEELTFGKHSGVISNIHRQFVKTGRMAKKIGRNLNWLFELRGVADYGATAHVSQKDADEAINIANVFVKTTVKLIQADDD